jgi:hypothetical protein
VATAPIWSCTAATRVAVFRTVLPTLTDIFQLCYAPGKNLCRLWDLSDTGKLRACGLGHMVDMFKLMDIQVVVPMGVEIEYLQYLQDLKSTENRTGCISKN